MNRVLTKVILLLSIASVLLIGGLLLATKILKGNEQDAGVSKIQPEESQFIELGYYETKPKIIHNSPMERILATDFFIEKIDERLKKSPVYNMNKEVPQTNGSFTLDDPLSKSGSKKRLLATENIVASPGIIAFNKQASKDQERYAYQYILTRLQQYSTQFIVYPYGFEYALNPTTPEIKESFSQGAVFTLKPDALPGSSAYNYFKAFKAVSDVHFGRAKALYDFNVAVLKIQGFYDDIFKDLTYETSLYCNILGSYLGKYTNCMLGSDYLLFTKDSRNAGKSAFVMMNQDDITKNNLLFASDGQIKFQILVIPDYYLDAFQVIQNTLGVNGTNKIKEYVNKGGLIFASGKAGYLLETWGILDKGTYVTSKLLYSQDPDSAEELVGCEDFGNEFVKALLCMNTTDQNNKGHTFLLSTFLMNSTNPSGLSIINSYANKNTVISANPSATCLLKKNLLRNGALESLTAAEKAYLPYTLYKNVSKGKVFIMNGNPLIDTPYLTEFYNLLFFVASRNVIFNSKVASQDNKPIPGGEAGINLDLSLSFMNVYDRNVMDMTLHVMFPNKLDPETYPADCVPDTTDISNYTDVTNLNPATHLKCSKSLMGPFDRFDAIIKVEITEATVTQQKYNILLAAAVVQYTDEETGITYTYEAGRLYTDAALAALLRGALNPDPSSFYPVKGRGQYVDNVLQVENKEDTSALDVEYIGVVPLISPLVDGSDQTAVVRLGKFLASYYNRLASMPFYYPFKVEEGKDYDYLDFMFLKGKNVFLDAEWDLPVKVKKETRDEAIFGPADGSGSLDIINMNYATQIDNMNIVLKQVFYPYSDVFMEHATQRLLVFVDTSLQAGANAYYAGVFPEGVENPNKPGIAKKELVWTRSDVYFYAKVDYQMPANINYTHVISIDRYDTNYTNCVAVFGNSKADIVVPGYFSNEKEDGLKANEYNNELLKYCEKKKVKFEDVEAVSGGSITTTHYLVPVTDPEILKASDIMNFVANADGTGYLTNYPELKFIYGHSYSTFVDGSYTRQGGKVEFILPEGKSFKDPDTFDPVLTHSVSYSADQVAFYRTTWDKTTRTLTGYFKRGLMPNEAYGKPSFIGFSFENLDSVEDIDVVMNIYEMKYDLSSPQTFFERFIPRYSMNVKLSYGRFYSLPAVELHVKMNRKGETKIYPYELMEPYARFGVYIQELEKHRTVWGSAESHHTSDPGVQAINGGFSMISNLGISSIPFVEYVTTGKALLIPYVAGTSRIEWYDIWGRKWSQPLRSVFPDVPPIPPPLRNFMMTTTYELTKTGMTDRVLDWNSEETLDIRVQIKLLNNYPKYFEITTCKDNEVPFFQYADIVDKSRIFDDPPYSYQIDKTQAPTSNYHINFGHRAVYGFCFDSPGTILTGITLDEDTRIILANAYLCAQTANATAMRECAEKLAGFPTVKRTDGTKYGKDWMYSPEIESYYPANYIKSIMWDMTHYDYDDTPMDKSYKYHMDNNLPGFDFGPSGNPSRYKPHNIIAQPIFKGFGYSITYDSNKSLPRFPNYKGWWSDNLQNKDHTLFAGQSSSNDVSVDKDTLLPSDKWVNAKDLIGPYTTSIVKSRLGNIHACLFNQHRVKLSTDQTIGAYLGNVYQNNIIPIIPDLDKNDVRLTNYNCGGTYQYSNTNISSVDNVVKTPTIRDWLYFAANLRGNALETINVAMTLSPMSVKYEGYAKIQDGGRFVYWNPANGPNSFLIVDNPVSVVLATRSDLSIDIEVFPKTTTTIKPSLYHLITVSDPAEIGRQWTSESYTNNYGFGDSVTAIYVGGAEATKVITNPGDYTIVKITLYNNAGFDWNMKGGAIDFDYVGSTPINANDLLNQVKHSIQKPKKYNFLKFNVPPELQPFVTITPSDHVLYYAPQFFDFTNINVVTVRDGFKGDYYVKIILSDTIPNDLQGRLHEIGVEIVESYFDKLPSYNDPTKLGYHDYHLQIPPIKIGIPYTSGDNKGSVFYTSGYSKNVVVSNLIPTYWNIEDVRFVTAEQIDKIRVACGNSSAYQVELLKVWQTLDPTSVPFSSVSAVDPNYKNITIDLTTSFPTFPKKNIGTPDTALVNFLMKVNTDQLELGTVQVISNPTVKYTDCRDKIKFSTIAAPTYRNVESKGAWFKTYYSIDQLILDSNNQFIIGPDEIYCPKTSQKCTLYFMTRTTVKNVGTDTAFHAKVNVTFSSICTVMTTPQLQLYNYEVKKTDDGNMLYINPDAKVVSGDLFTVEANITCVLKPIVFRRRQLATPQYLFTIINSAATSFDQTKVEGVSQASAQAIITPKQLNIIDLPQPTVSLSGTVTDPTFTPSVKLTALANPTTTLSGKSVRYLYLRKTIGLNCRDDPTGASTGLCANIIQNTPVAIQTYSGLTSCIDQPVPKSFTGIILAADFYYIVETYDEYKVKIATNSYYFNYNRGATLPQSDPVQPDPVQNPEPEDRPVANPTDQQDQQDAQREAEEELYGSLNDTNDSYGNTTEEYAKPVSTTSNKVLASSGLQLWSFILISVSGVAVFIVITAFLCKRFSFNPKIHDATSVEVVFASPRIPQSCKPDTNNQG